MLNFNLVVDLLDGAIPLAANPESQIKSLLGIRKAKDYKAFIKKVASLAGQYPINEAFKGFLKQELEKQKFEGDKKVSQLEAEYIAMLSFEKDAEELVKAKFLQFEKLASVASSFGELKPKEVKVELTKFLGGTEVAQDTAADFLAVYHNGLSLSQAEPEKKNVLQKRLIKSVNKYLTGSPEVTDSSAGYVLEMINGLVLASNGITVAQEAIDALKVETPLDKQAQAADEDSIPDMQRIEIPDSLDTESFVSSVQSNLAIFQNPQALKFEEDEKEIAKKDALQEINAKIQSVHLLDEQLQDLKRLKCKGFEDQALEVYRDVFKFFDEEKGDEGADVEIVRAEEKEQGEQSVKGSDQKICKYAGFMRVFKAATISDLFADVDEDEIEYHAAAAYVFFGDDLDRLEHFLTEYKSARSPYHDAFYHALPILRTDELDSRVALNFWRDFIKQNSDNPEIIKALILNFSGVVKIQEMLHIGKDDDEVTIPSDEQLLGAIEELNSYEKAGANPELAKVYQTYAIPERVFNKTLEVIDRADLKVEDTIPDVVIDVAQEVDEIKGRDLYFVKLPVVNYRGFILGHITDCCQSIGGHSEKVVIDGMTRKNNSFYVLIEAGQDGFNPNAIDWDHFEENGNKICGQGYVWRAKDGALVFDSWENNSTKHNSIMLPVFQKFGEKLEATVDRVVVGAGGKTPAEIKKSTPEGIRSKMLEGYDYGDAKIQHEVFVSSSLQEARSFIEQVFSIEDSLFIKSTSLVEFVRQHIDVFLNQISHRSEDVCTLSIVKKMLGCADVCIREEINNPKEIGVVFNYSNFVNVFKCARAQAVSILVDQDVEKIEALKSIKSGFSYSDYNDAKLEALKVILDQDVERIKELEAVKFVGLFHRFCNEKMPGGDGIQMVLAQDIAKIKALEVLNSRFFNSFCKDERLEALQMVLAQDIAKIKALEVLDSDFFASFCEGKKLVALQMVLVQDVDKIQELYMYPFYKFGDQATEALKVLAAQDVDKIQELTKINFFHFGVHKYEALTMLVAQDDLAKIQNQVQVVVNKYWFAALGDRVIDALTLLLEQGVENAETIDLYEMMKLLEASDQRAAEVFEQPAEESVGTLPEPEPEQAAIEGIVDVGLSGADLVLESSLS